MDEDHILLPRIFTLFLTVTLRCEIWKWVLNFWLVRQTSQKKFDRLAAVSLSCVVVVVVVIVNGRLYKGRTSLRIRTIRNNWTKHRRIDHKLLAVVYVIWLRWQVCIEIMYLIKFALNRFTYGRADPARDINTIIAHIQWLTVICSYLHNCTNCSSCSVDQPLQDVSNPGSPMTKVLQLSMYVCPFITLYTDYLMRVWCLVIKDDTRTRLPTSMKGVGTQIK